MKITIPGSPVAKARARVKFFKGKAWSFDPQEKEKKRVIKIIKDEVSKYYEKTENRIEGYKLANGEAFEVSWHFYMPIPKSFNQRKKNACKWGFIEHTSKPDRSNLEKFYEDCANGILWKDDSQIVKGEIVKKYCYDDKPRTEVIMKTIKEPNKDLMNIVSLFSPQEISDIVESAKSLPVTENPSLTSIGFFISKVADQHANKFTKIAKNYPGYWKSFE